jgi:hypothetical protein
VPVSVVVEVGEVVSIEYEGWRHGELHRDGFHRLSVPHALVSADPTAYLPDPRQALAAHHLAWAAEQARLTASVIDLVGADRP